LILTDVRGHILHGYNWENVSSEAFRLDGQEIANVNDLESVDGRHLALGGLVDHMVVPGRSPWQVDTCLFFGTVVNENGNESKRVSEASLEQDVEGADHEFAKGNESAQED